MTLESILNVIALTVYLILVVYPSFSTPKSKINYESYTRGKGSYGIVLIAIAMTVTMVGPADALALSQNGLKYGCIWAVLPIGAALSQLVTGYVFAKKIKTQFPRIKSIGDIYDISCSKSSKIFTGLIAFVQSIAFAGVLVLAGGQVLETFLQLDKVMGMVLTAVVVGAYTSFNGFVGVVQTDKLQGGFMGLMLVLLMVVSIVILVNLDQSNMSAVFIKNTFKEDYNFHILATLFVGYFLGELLLPPYCIRMSVSETPKSAARAFKLASVLLIFWYFIIALAGSLGEFVTASTPNSENLILVNVIRSLISDNTLNYLVGAFCLLVFVSLIHSTFDTFLNNGAISFSRDILGSLFKMSEPQLLWASKQVTISIAIFGLIIAIWKNDLIDILFLGYTIWVPTVLGSLIWILFNPRKRLSSSSFWLGMLAGITIWTVFEYLIVGIVPAILAGLIFNFVTIHLLQLNKTQLRPSVLEV